MELNLAPARCPELWGIAREVQALDIGGLRRTLHYQFHNMLRATSVRLSPPLQAGYYLYRDTTVLQQTTSYNLSRISANHSRGLPSYSCRLSSCTIPHLTWLGECGRRLRCGAALQPTEVGFAVMPFTQDIERVC